ncbi:hypothetical protein LTR17_015173 [Elasticomyces elasticus]|nr:hypothetical protein LTR17_015173 [Elasticomyces elasticus]
MASSSGARYGEAMELDDRTQRFGTNKSIEPVVHSREDESLEKQDGEVSATKSTGGDVAVMRRMGKEQELIRHFRMMSITSFAAVATASWEIGLFVITPGLIDGGVAGLCWSVLVTFFCWGAIYLSLAEMASIAPIAGAQYHWVSEFAPESCQRILSYITGWTSTIAWQAGNAQGIFIVGSLIQTIILVNNEDYAFPNWHGSLLAMGAMLIGYVANVYGSRALPYWQNAIFAVHIMGYFAYIVPLWVNAPTASHSQVWLEFANEGGWSSTGLAVMVGQLAAISLTTGVDSAVHMSEETRDSQTSIPYAMMAVFCINFCLVFPAVLTVAYHITDLEAAVNDSTTYPAIWVLRQAMSVPLITVILVIILVLNVASNIVYLAAVTRDLFAFARDNGLPFSKWISEVNQKRMIPVNATILSGIIATLLACIYIGSPVAFYAITSLSTVSLLQCYCLSIGCFLWRRIYHPETLPPAKFSLGRWGIPINAFAVLYSIWGFFWAFWPQATPVTAAGFNWASPIFVVVLIVALLYFVFRAKHTYFGPVVDVEGRNVRSGR